ncbi:MAG: cytochrome d ubiquinol oxidase subunit II [Cyclobacteriaceae bacterium]
MDTLFGLDYPTWWFLVTGGLFSGYAILDGFDFGAGAWHLFFKSNENRRIALNAVGPVWDGNEVWLVIGGGALFAGFPVVYGTLLSVMYIPFMLFLMALIFRAIAIEFRGKEPMRWWRRTWDVTYSIASMMLAFLLGVVLGNVLQGFEIGMDQHYLGDGFFEFLNPYSLLLGATTLTLFMSHGAIFLLLKTDGSLYDQLIKLQRYGMIAFIVIFSITSVYTLLYIPHLSAHLKENELLFGLPILAFLSIANIPRLAHKKKFRHAFVFSSLTISLLLVLTAIEIYPNVLLSTIDPQYNIDIYAAAASEKTLKIMMFFVAIGGPLVLSYTVFVYKTFWGKVEIDESSY